MHTRKQIVALMSAPLINSQHMLPDQICVPLSSLFHSVHESGTIIIKTVIIIRWERCLFVLRYHIHPCRLSQTLKKPDFPYVPPFRQPALATLFCVSFPFVLLIIICWSLYSASVSLFRRLSFAAIDSLRLSLRYRINDPTTLLIPRTVHITTLCRSSCGESPAPSILSLDASYRQKEDDERGWMSW